LNIKFTQARSFIANKVIALKNGNIKNEFATVFNKSLNKYILPNLIIFIAHKKKQRSLFGVVLIIQI
jgi:hypothetical protein